MGYVYEVEDVEWYEGYVEVYQLVLEGMFVLFFVEGEVECFWELEGEVGQVVEYCVVDDGVVEVGDQEQVVVQQEVCVWDGQQDVGYVVDGEGYYEVQGLQDWCVEVQVVFVDGEQLVEQFYFGGD